MGAQELSSDWRWLSLAEFNRGLHHCDRCGQPAIYVRSGATGEAVKACTTHRSALADDRAVRVARLMRAGAAAGMYASDPEPF